MHKNTIAVIGGGPAGMMAAVRAGQLLQNVILIERNLSLGKKLLLSGKGRCNLTNTRGLESFLKSFSKNGQFLRDAFKKFFNHELMDFFEKRGLRLKVERQLRVFPVTDRSDSVLKVLEEELRKNKIRVIYNSRVKGIMFKGGSVEGVIFEGGGSMLADRVIIATGGLSYPGTGSTGDGIRLAEKSGHDIVAVMPGLAALEVKGTYPALIEGLSLKNIRLIFTDGKKEIVSEIGELIFTRTGISGPLVLSLSGRVADWMAKGKNISVMIDLKPALSLEKLEERILREISLGPKKTVKNMLKNLLPQALIGLFMTMASLNPDKKVSYLSRPERGKLVKLLKGLSFKIAGPRPLREAMVTRGGVSLKDINPRTMESRIVKGLYFAGEVIDVDADTGGFNLQAAFSTGYLAGESASATYPTS